MTSFYMARFTFVISTEKVKMCNTFTSVEPLAKSNPNKQAFTVSHRLAEFYDFDTTFSKQNRWTACVLLTFGELSIKPDTCLLQGRMSVKRPLWTCETHFSYSHWRNCLSCTSFTGCSTNVGHKVLCVSFCTSGPLSSGLGRCSSLRSS